MSGCGADLREARDLCLARRFFWRAFIWGWCRGFGFSGADRGINLLVAMAADDRREYVDARSIDMDAGLDGSHQVSLSLVRLSPTVSS